MQQEKEATFTRTASRVTRKRIPDSGTRDALVGKERQGTHEVSRTAGPRVGATHCGREAGSQPPLDETAKGFGRKTGSHEKTGGSEGQESGTHYGESGSRTVRVSLPVAGEETEEEVGKKR